VQIFVLCCEDSGYWFAFGVELKDPVELRLRVRVSNAFAWLRVKLAALLTFANFAVKL
jgi:hypothetical protein